MLKQNKEAKTAPVKQPGAFDRVIGSFASFFGNRSVWIPTVVTVVILLMLAATVIVAFEVMCLRDRVASAEEKLATLTEDTQNLRPGWVDSSFTDVQPLDLGFSLVDFKAESVDAGVRVSGAVINGSSLDHYDAVFTISLGENRRTKVTIPKLAAGHSAPFEAIVGPATDNSIPGKIRVLFSGSTVSYY
ncbi:MAG: hypothetical protein JW765_08810 [Deltaproteobacteria bacterium]|nr:hypothetical protein [Candidatus Zymogenaceae bacterium]